MAKYDFRILLETVQGNRSSYMTQSFVDTDVDLVLSSSQVYDRITGSLSCSYQNQHIFTGNFQDPLAGETTASFKTNNLLSASLSGSQDTGSIVFSSLDTEYDRLLRYKFFGEKVCNVLGLPSSQWVYVDQVRLPADEESNFFQGNIKANNLFVDDQITFGNSSTINSDIPIQIDTGSDRYIKFIDTTNVARAGVIFGYDKDSNSYELNSGDSDTFDIKISTGSISIIGEISSSATITANTYDIREGVQALSYNSTTGMLSLGASADVNKILYGKTGAVRSGHQFIGNITASNNISASGTIFANTLEVTEFTSSFITSSTIVTEGSNIFGDTDADTHTFNGEITASSNISASGTGSFSYIDLPHLGKIKFDSPDTSIYSDAGGNEGLVLEADNTIILDPDTNVLIKGSGNQYVNFDGSTNRVHIGDDIGGTDPAKTLTVAGEISSSGDISTETGISASGDIHVGEHIKHLGDEGTHIRFTDDQVTIKAGGTTLADFVESSTNLIRFTPNTLIGTATGTPATTLDVRGDISSSGFISTLSHITASGNISASENILGKIIQGNTSLKADRIQNLAQDEPYLEIANNFDVKIGDPQDAGNSTLLLVDDTNQIITANKAFEITNTTDATDASGDTGALMVEGGVSIAKKAYVGTDLSVGGDISSSNGTGSFGKVVSNGHMRTEGTNPYFIAQESTSEFLKMGVDGISGDMQIGCAGGDSLHFGKFSSPLDSTVDTKMWLNTTYGSLTIGNGTFNTQHWNRLSVEGSVSASGAVTASSLIIDPDGSYKGSIKAYKYLPGSTGNLNVETDVSASGNVYARSGSFDGTISGSQLYSSNNVIGQQLRLTNASSGIYGNNNLKLVFSADDNIHYKNSRFLNSVTASGALQVNSGVVDFNNLPKATNTLGAGTSTSTGQLFTVSGSQLPFSGSVSELNAVSGALFVMIKQ